jgi:hypothetical protein
MLPMLPYSMRKTVNNFEKLGVQLDDWEFSVLCILRYRDYLSSGGRMQYTSSCGKQDLRL